MSLRRDIVILVCAISAGIHGALAPEHFREGAGAGFGFVAATVLLAVIAAALTLHPEGDLLVLAAALVLAGLITSYVLAVTTGLPLLHPEPEAVDGVGMVTKAIEAIGLLVAATLPLPPSGRPIPLFLTALIAAFSGVAALAAAGGHHGHTHGAIAHEAAPKSSVRRG